MTVAMIGRMGNQSVLGLIDYSQRPANTDADALPEPQTSSHAHQKSENVETSEPPQAQLPPLPKIAEIFQRVHVSHKSPLDLSPADSQRTRVSHKSPLDLFPSEQPQN